MAQSAPYDQRVANACEGMGLNPSEATFVYCEMSLQGNIAAAPRIGETKLARRACIRAGYRFGTASFADCMLGREESTAGAAAPRGDSFGFYQRGDEMTSVHRACAQIGLVPGSQQYATCVGNLDMTIDDANRVGTD